LELFQRVRKGDVMLHVRERELLQILWREGRLSRWELHERSGQTPNGVGNVVGNLIKKGILRECPAGPSTGGRPRVPVEVDPESRHVVGLILAPGRAEVCRLNLCGQLMGDPVTRVIEASDDLVHIGAGLLSDTVNEETLSVGVAITGLVDLDARSILLSSALPGEPRISIQPLYEAVEHFPLMVTNDVQALGVRWMLTHRADLALDVLLVGFGDGHIGAAMMVEGHPNKGCVLGANELGHTRFPVETAQCYCGKTGCLERVFSTPFLQQQGTPSAETLETALSTSEPGPTIQKMTSLLAMGISNSANFVRPHRLVLVSEFMRYRHFARNLENEVRSMLLPEISGRVRIDEWELSDFESAETAAWSALANLYANDWEPVMVMDGALVGAH
jgi:predicted NBD/HSP70 family sugar kinase